MGCFKGSMCNNIQSYAMFTDSRQFHTRMRIKVKYIDMLMLLYWVLSARSYPQVIYINNPILFLFYDRILINFYKPTYKYVDDFYVYLVNSISLLHTLDEMF